MSGAADLTGGLFHGFGDHAAKIIGRGYNARVELRMMCLGDKEQIRAFKRKLHEICSCK